MKNDFVKKGYNKIAKDYISNRDQFKNDKYLEKFTKLLQPNSLILDIGCGAGIPVDKYLIGKGHKVIGIDISEKMIELAKENVPGAEYAVRDMSELKVNDFKVDAVVSFYAIFHTPRTKHQDLFKKINSFLPEGGLILVTMGSSDWQGNEKDFHGTEMFWSHYGSEKNRELITTAGFKIIFDEVDLTEGERHQVILAKKLMNL